MRNLQSIRLQPDPRINFIVGPNGSGKTSLLEAISILSCGRSFRSSQVKKVVSHSSADLSVYGEVIPDLETTIADRIGIQRCVDGSTAIRINGQRSEKMSSSALMLPTVDIEANSFEFIEGGASLRRELLDWGLFHVEHSFLPVWKRYKAALDQKNALLRNSGNGNLQALLQHWNRELAGSGEQLHRIRLHYTTLLKDALNRVNNNYLLANALDIRYKPGWNIGGYSSLSECFALNVENEIVQGRSLHGPHKADLEILWDGHLVRDICSRGQKKLVLYGVRLAQVMVLHELKGVLPVLLLDDLPAELDSENIKRISRFLADYPCQSFITAIDKELENSGLLSTFSSNKVFHVEHGRLI